MHSFVHDDRKRRNPAVADTPLRPAGIGTSTDWGDLYKHLLNQAEHVKNANAEFESRFNLDAALKSLGMLPDESVYGYPFFATRETRAERSAQRGRARNQSLVQTRVRFLQDVSMSANQARRILRRGRGSRASV
jgi:hypothetical protein